MDTNPSMSNLISTNPELQGIFEPVHVHMLLLGSREHRRRHGIGSPWQKWHAEGKSRFQNTTALDTERFPAEAIVSVIAEKVLAGRISEHETDNRALQRCIYFDTYAKLHGVSADQRGAISSLQIDKGAIFDGGFPCAVACAIAIERIDLDEVRTREAQVRQVS